MRRGRNHDARGATADNDQQLAWSISEHKGWLENVTYLLMERDK